MQSNVAGLDVDQLKAEISKTYTVRALAAVCRTKPPTTRSRTAMSDDRWWRGFDSQIVDTLWAGARVLDVGCGDGGLVERLVECGLDAFGVDPRAAERPRLLPQRVEEAGSLGRFDAVCAVMSLHHADLDAVLSAVTRLLRPGGHLFAYELAWEAYDARAAAWLTRYDRSGTDNSVRGWKLEHANLHTGATIRTALIRTFDEVIDRPWSYLARMLGVHELEQEEQALIDRTILPALGRWYVADPR